ncbi:MAG: ABC transporter permease [Spirochaetaceae bacterium]|jgi:ribose/xylose/arabinose/galactoside ABC-type transport system permease subunit|nr:ABC transporter permease [Spirochaetaceae bacterium]GMO17327.1 MAG: ribose ABC transporter permease RbsC [Termitinemataceae bacterium]
MNLNKANVQYIGKLKKFSSFIGMLIIFIVFCILDSSFLSVRNITNILQAAAPLFFMVMGLSFVILTGGIDLSTGAVCSCVCVFVGLYISGIGNMVFFAVILIGIAAGLLNGVLTAFLKMPSFIVTLCTLSLWKCATLIISDAGSKSIPVETWPVFSWASKVFFVFPVPYIIALFVFALFVFVERRTSTGTAVYAVGANVLAARMAGIDIKKTQVMAYILSGVGSALAGAFYALRLKASVPTIGDSLNLVAIAAVVLGGLSLAGGRGTVVNALPSVITVVMLQTALKVVGLDAYWQNIVFGIVLIIAIYINSDAGSAKDAIIK